MRVGYPLRIYSAYSVCHSGGVTARDTASGVPRSHERRFSPDSLEELKEGLRRDTRRRRGALDARTREDAAERIALQVAELVDELGLAPGDIAAAYVSRPAEPGTLPTLELLRERSLRVLVPVLGQALTRDWGEYTGVADLDQRAPGRPLEPPSPVGDCSLLAHARLILVPALRIDAEGHRLGQGGGWYDRALHHASPDAELVAVVFDDEIADSPLPREHHDLPVRGVLTPSRRWRIEPGREAASAGE